MAINFPNSPTIGQSHTHNSRTWVWDGVSWNVSIILQELNDLTSSVTWDDVPDANITESSVKQHEAALSIIESQISDLQHYTDSALDLHLNLISAGDGQVLSWNDSAGEYVWVNQSSGSGASVTVSDIAPGNPSSGDLWWDSVDGVLKIYYTDSDSSQWVDASPSGVTGVDPVDQITDGVNSVYFDSSNEVIVGSTLNVLGQIRINGVQESFSLDSNSLPPDSTGVVNFDVSQTYIHRVDNLQDNIIANLQNLDLSSSHVTNISIVFDQGIDPYIVSDLEISDVAQVIKWQGGNPPTGTSEGVDIFSFTIFNDSDSVSGQYTVLGQMINFS